MALTIKVTGAAEIYDRGSRETVHIPAAKVEWHRVGTVETPDGTETVWEGRVTDPRLGDLIWSIVEMPDGGVGSMEHDLDPECVIREFDVVVV